MKKRVVSLLLCLIMALSLIPTVAFADDTDANANTPAAQQGEVAVQDDHHKPTMNPTTKKLGYKTATIEEHPNDNGYTISYTTYPEANITVSDGTNNLTWGQASVALNGDSYTNKTITISVAKGYYVTHVVLCCNDGEGYRCQTSRGNNAFGIEGSADSNQLTVTLDSLKGKVSHRDQHDQDYYWLMIAVAKCPAPVYVGYDVGKIGNYTINATPITQNIVDDGGAWMGTLSLKKYLSTTNAINNGDVKHTALGISTDAANAAANYKTSEAPNGYEFAGWKVERYQNCNDNGAFSSQTDTGTANIVSAGQSVALITHTKLIAQWTPKAAPSTIDITVTKAWNNIADGFTAPKADSVKVNLLKDNAPTDQYVVLNADNNWTGEFKNLDAKSNYTVQEETVAGYTPSYNRTGNTITITNTPKWENEIAVNSAGLTIKKVDASTKVLLSGAVFELSKDKTVFATNTTGNDGLCAFSNLEAGTYTLKEITAPANYNLGTTEWTIVVEGENSVVKTANNTYQKVTTYKIKSVTSNDHSAVDFISNTNGNFLTVENTLRDATTAKITINKKVDVTGNTQPSTMPTFTFVAKVGGKEVGKLSLTPTKGTDGKWTASGDMPISIPANLFGSQNYVEVTISEVKGNLNYWTYDSKEYTLKVTRDGKNADAPAITSVPAEVKPIASFTFTNTYNYTYTPPTRPTNPIRRQPTTTKPVQSVKTGDMGIALYAVTSLLSLSGTALVIKKRKDEK